ELRFEAAGRKVALVVELASVSHPLVDQDQTRAILVKQLPQNVTRAGCPLVVGFDPGESLLATELPGELAPKSTHHRAIRLGDRVAGRDFVAHQHRTPHRRKGFSSRLLHYDVDAGDLIRHDS